MANEEEIKKLQTKLSDQRSVPRGPKKNEKQEKQGTLIDLSQMDDQERIYAIHENFNSQK